MSETTITQLPDPSGFSSDPFTDVLRDGARKLIEQAIHAELATLMNAFSKEKLEDGRARLVRHGHSPRGHVGFFVRKTAASIEALGGNQADAVNIKRYSKTRLLGIRRSGSVAPAVTLSVRDVQQRLRALG